MKTDELNALNKLTSESGDAHNFGRSTHAVLEDGEKFFLKHRDLFWEWLFFGEDSPLKETMTRILGSEFSESVFGLSVKLPLSTHEGSVKSFSGIQDFSQLKRDPRSYVNLGKQCAYFASLGMIDLLLENLRLVNGGFQVIDAECIFNLTTSLEDSALLPPRGEKFTPKFGLFPYFYQVRDKELFAHLILGYADGLLRISQARDAMLKELEKFIADRLMVPIRILLRATGVYDVYLTEGELPEVPFCPEEREQLARGDVPYFFRRLGDKKISFYVSTEFSEAPILMENIPKTFGLRGALELKELLNPNRLTKILLWSGVSSIYRWGSLGEGPYLAKTDGLEIRLDKKTVVIYATGLDPIEFMVTG